MTIPTPGQIVFGSVGLTTLAWSVFGIAVLLCDLPRCLPSLIYLAEIISLGALYLLAGLTGIALIRGRRRGVWALLLLVGLVLGAASFGVPLLESLAQRVPSWVRAPSPSILLIAFLVPITAGLGRRWPAKVPVSWGFIALGLASTSVAAAYGWAGLRDVAEVAVRRGNEFERAGRVDEAVAIWRAVLVEFPGSTPAANARCSIASSLEGRDFDAAAALYEEALTDQAAAWPTCRRGSNFSYSTNRICIRLVYCHAGRGDLEAALKFARLGRHVYPPDSWCGTCNHHSRKMLDVYIACLERGEPLGEIP